MNDFSVPLKFNGCDVNIKFEMEMTNTSHNMFVMKDIISDPQGLVDFVVFTSEKMPLVSEGYPFPVCTCIPEWTQMHKLIK